MEHRGGARNAREAAQDGRRGLHIRLVDVHLLEAPLERGVLLNVLAVLVERRCADAAQLARASAGLSRFPASMAPPAAPAPTTVWISSMKSTTCPIASCTSLSTAFRRSSNSPRNGARNERTHVQREQLAVKQRLGGVAGGDALRQPLSDGGFTHTGLADQDRVVLGTPREDSHGAAHLVVAADDRVELAVLCLLRQIPRVLFEGLVGRLLRRG